LHNWRYRNRILQKKPDQHLLDANRNLREMLEDTSIPASVRAELDQEFHEIESIAEKLRNEEIHVAVFGRVGAGKSSLLNALLDRQVFSTSPLHGETQTENRHSWQAVKEGHVELIDTPGIDELGGEEREGLAHELARRSDVLLFICEGDLTESEFHAVQDLAARQRPVILVLNKSDRYGESELQLVLARLRQRCAPFLSPGRVLATAADPRPEKVVRENADGRVTEFERPRAADVVELRNHLWQLLEREGKSLAALNAALFASELDARIATQIVTARKAVAERIIRNYCLAKGVAVAVNPIPVADLLAAAGTDIAMVIHLGEVYGFRLSRREATRLLFTIAAQLAALMRAYWSLNLVSSAMKTVSAGLSTALTAGAQGALAWYATYLVGKVAASWFSRGKSWGQAGPRETVRSILDSLDRDSIILSAREDILRRIGRP
jgi:small GTP-binding protein